MRTGGLRHIVTFQRQSTTQDTVGQLLDTWTDLITRRASIEPLNGREYFNASGENSKVSTRIRARYSSEVAVLQPYDRIIDNSVSPRVVYDIQSIINPKERNHEMVFMCNRL